ncbi:hypothetical protein [Streptomyces sp. NPDC002205]|uniref:hypothetical protein n=1 Tax=Streptomyces sp. NPDC002205 TaxID=3154411 RepID=UPI0033345A8C
MSAMPAAGAAAAGAISAAVAVHTPTRNPSGSDYIGPVVRDIWRNGYGLVKLSV